MEKRRDDYVDVLDLANADECRSNLDAVPNVRPIGFSLPALILMNACRKLSRFEDCDRIGNCRSPIWP
jgi:hypothetical protein